jgi:AraC-like DNA-binding protein
VLPENTKVCYLLFHLETLMAHVGWDQFPEGRFDLTASMQAYLHAMVHPLLCPGSPEVWLAVQLINLLSDLRNATGSGQKNGKDLIDYVLKADSIIRQNLTEKMTDNQIAKLVGYHETGLKAAFKTYFDMGMAKWRNLQRIERAQQLILRTDMSLTEIQLSCGYEVADTFRQNFEEITGLKPAAWRKKYKHEYAK